MTKLRIAAALLLCLFFTNAFAQTTNATLGGTVADATGALIPGVSVTATNTGTGIVSTTITNEAGAYQFPVLQPGTYKVSAELTSFQTKTYSDFALGGSQQARLNFTLEVSSVSQGVDVTIAADTLLATSSSSVGAVLPEYKVRELPLADRNALGLLKTTAGVQASGNVVGSMVGGRTNMVNTTRDGMNVQDGRYDNGAFSVTYTSPDLVEEVRVIVAPADAETARGSGQVQMTTRSGTNQYRGSVFWTDRNSALDANDWFNNFNGTKKNYVNRNQFGGRLGGPIVKNKTFFFFLFEAQRTVHKDSIIANVLTDQARQGIFRYFPGVQNGNIFSSKPTVDANGNPVTPAGATGPLSSFNIFTKDPLRTSIDPSGYIASMLAKMPMPNDFTVGDGLNTAGYRWTRRSNGNDPGATGVVNDNDRNQYNLRIDHTFNARHKLSVVGTRERDWIAIGLRQWPQGFDGLEVRVPDVYTVSSVSTLSSNLVNEFRAGKRTSTQWWWNAPTLYAPDGNVRKPPRTIGPGITELAKQAFALVPQRDGIPFTPTMTNWAGGALGVNGNSRGTLSPLTQYADSISWTSGAHAFKGGVEWRTGATTGGHDQDAWPRVNLGAGGVAVTGIDGTTVPGLTGSDQGNARSLLTDLNGSIGTITQAFYIVDSLKEFKPYPTESVRYRDYRGREWSAFFKDDWKARANLTLNLGVRYDFYGAPWDQRGVLARPAGGEKSLFGLSGTSFADLYQPGHLAGSLTSIEFVGKHGPNPQLNLQRNDWNNLAPTIGLSWTVPWFGKDKTTLRAGYGIAYATGSNRLASTNSSQGSIPGLNVVPNLSFSTYTNLSTLHLPISGPGIPGVPLEAVPLTSRNQALRGFDDGWSTEYIQNYSMELQRELAKNLTVEVRYVGSKGTKLYGGTPVNTANIFENGILDAYNITRAGGNAPLFDQMLKGLNLGLGAVNGTTITGSASLRQNTLFRAFIANGDVGQFASLLNTTNTVTGEGGGLLRANKFPENFIVANPQFTNVTVDGNPGNSTYHSLNLSVTKRLSSGFTNQTTYTWSKTIGENDGDGTTAYLNPRNQSLNKTLLSFHHTHDIRSNGSYTLPFGKGKPFLANSPKWVTGIVGNWTLAGIFSFATGQPLTITASSSSFSENTSMTPNIVGAFPKTVGKVTKLATGVTYFGDFKQVTDPGGSVVTTLQSTNTSFSNKALADAAGNLLLVNPDPGTIGNLGLQWIKGPSSLGLDMDLIKQVQISESKNLEFRLDAINILNHPIFGSPTLDINSTSFGRITSASGARSFTLNTRFNF